MKFLIEANPVPLPGRLIYHPHEWSFDFEPSESDFLQQVCRGGVTSVSIETLQIEIAVDTGHLLFVWGYHPHTAWRVGRLTPVNALPGGVRLHADQPLQRGVSLGLAEIGEWGTVFDPTSGWLRLAPPKSGEGGSAVEFATDTVLSIQAGSIQALWLRPHFSSPLPTPPLRRQC